MEVFIRYILMSTFCISVLYVGYLLFFKKENRFNQHRYYLLFTILISVIMPFSTYHINIESTKTSEAYSIVENIQKTEPITNLTKDNQISQQKVKFIEHNHLNIYSLLFILYFTVLSFLILRLLLHIFRIFMLARTCTQIKQERSTLFLNAKIKSPFSFFTLVFIPSDYLNNDEKKNILLHENIHASQYHSLDLILIELLVATMWFNPLVWMMKKSIQSVHEYLADEGVLNTGTDKLRYQALLINQVVEERLICLSSGFNQSLIKKRIMMMTKSEIDQSSKLRILSLIPLAIIVFIAVSCVNGQQKTTSGVTLIEPLNMNILYVGVDNPVKISTSGYDLSELTATVDNGTISGKEGTYIITPKKPGKANVSVSYKGKVIQTTFFRVKPLPSPIAMISGTKGGNISKEKLLKAKAIYPIMENFDFEAVFEIEGFTVSTIINGYIIDEVSTSNEITANQRDLITKTGIGQELFFKKIKCKGPDGTIKELPVIDVIITE